MSVRTEIAPSPSEKKPGPRRRIVIVGAGGSGLAAAVAALQSGAGAQVTLLEKNHSPGGITQLSTASMWACDTRYQRDAGIDGVGVVEGLRHYLDTGEWAQPEITILSRYLANSAPLLDWLIGLGCPWAGKPSGFNHPFVAIREGAGKGSGITDTLSAYVYDNGGTIELGTRATELMVVDRAVVGVKAVKEGREVEYEADAVVLCDGGTWGAGREELGEYIPPDWHDITQTRLFSELSGSWGTAGTGDAARMAAVAGAQISHMDVLEYTAQGWFDAQGRRHPRKTMSASLWHVAQAIILNQDLERFVNEVPGSKTGITDGRRSADHADQQMNAVTSEGHGVIDELRRRGETWFWSVFDAVGRDANYVIQTELKDPVTLGESYILVGDTIGELADQMGVSGLKLAATINEYNSYFDDGLERDPRYGRRLVTPVSTGPFYALRQGLSVSCTMGGIVVDAEMQVQAASGGVVRNLYAAGQSIDSYLFNGNGSVTGGLSTFLSIGRIAGENAARGDLGAGVRQGRSSTR